MRLLLILIVALALAPGTWLRSEVPPDDFTAPVSIIAVAERAGVSGQAKLTGVWQIASTNDHFGGYSALVWLGGGELLAGSDRARTMRLTLEDGAPAQPELDYWIAEAGDDKRAVDLEALTYDRDTGTLWASFEYRNMIERHTRGSARADRVYPAQMRGWGLNSGGESLVRLADGRFLIIRESASGWSSHTHPALLFGDDPLVSRNTTAFELAVPADYRPVDAAQLPDGRVMIVLRRLVMGFPQSFTSALMVADPADIADGEVWQGEIVARIDGALAENYEGLAVIPRANGGAALYLISDDNVSQFQRTLLLRLEWPGASRESQRETARESPRAP